MPLQMMRKLFSRPRNRRSVLFLNHSYYHFWYLAQALRRRGWDAITVNADSPNSPHSSYYHGEDLNLYLPFESVVEKEIASKEITKFLKKAKRRFRLMHFAGDGHLSFYPWSIGDEDPADIVDWRAAGLRIAYTSSGCNSGSSQTGVASWSRTLGTGSVCDRCPWQNRPEVCNDARNLAWGRKIARYCDLIFSETIPALDYVRSGPRVFREPVTTALDPRIWDPNLQIPPQYFQRREAGEVLIYHGFGNYQARSQDGRNIKGTPAIFAAIERLRGEGLPVRLIFCTDLPSTDVRFVQVQTDIIVDQLNYGRYGAQAREGMMLGKPVVCYVNPREHSPVDELDSLKEVPLVSATEETIYAVLKDLVIDRGKRLSVGEASRRYAMKWHSADACAERYEKIYDEMMARSPQLGTYAVAD